MTTTQTIIIISLIAIFGFTDILKKFIKIKSDIGFAKKYRDNFNVFRHNKKFEIYEYEWLTLNAPKIQNQLGSYGTLDYQPPFENYFINNYQLIVNTIPQMRTQKAHHHDVLAVDDSLMRYIGNTMESLKLIKSQMVNPIMWIIQGLKLILLSPIQILNWIGIINNRIMTKISNSIVVKIISFIAFIIGLFGSIITIVLGWNQFIAIINAVVRF